MSEAVRAATVAAPEVPAPGPLKSALFTVVFLGLLACGVEAGARLLTSAETPHAAEVLKIEDNYLTSEESMFVLDRELLWRPRPHYESDFRYMIDLNPIVTVPETYHVTLNSHGFRGGALRTPKPPVRIACVGDSVTFGLNAPDEYAYPAVMQQQFDRVAPGHVEAINAGVPSYSSDHGVLWLEQAILPLEPDLVILGYGHNDVWMHPRELRIFLAAHGRSDWRSTAQRVLNHSAAYRAYKVALLRARSAAAPDAVDPELATKTYANYERMLTMLKERGIPALILVLYNQRPGVVAQLERVAEDFDTPVYDVRPVFEMLGADRMMSEQKHPSTAGYQVIGAGLANLLAPQFGLPKPPPLGAETSEEAAVSEAGAPQEPAGV